MFNFRIKKVLDFLRFNKSDLLKVLKLKNFNIPYLSNLLIQKPGITNTILILNVTNTPNVVDTYLIITKSRANYTFLQLYLRCLKVI